MLGSVLWECLPGICGCKELSWWNLYYENLCLKSVSVRSLHGWIQTTYEHLCLESMAVSCLHGWIRIIGIFGCEELTWWDPSHGNLCLESMAVRTLRSFHDGIQIMGSLAWYPGCEEL